MKSSSLAVTSGSSTQAQVPLLPSLSRPTSPPIKVASSRQIDRPSPLPPKRRVVELSACVNGWNSVARSSALTPMPVSLISMRATAGVRRNRCTSMLPRLVNFSAFDR